MEMKVHITLGERNPIEGKFGQSKNAYRLNRIKAKLQQQANLGLPPLLWY